MDSITICRTCPRDAPQSGVYGTNLRKAVQAELQSHGVEVLMVHCLGNCRVPCSVALDSPQKNRIRFSGVDIQDARDLIDTAIAYSRSQSGVADNVGFATALKSKISAVSPKHSITQHTDLARPNFRSNLRGA